MVGKVLCTSKAKSRKCIKLSSILTQGPLKSIGTSVIWDCVRRYYIGVIPWLLFHIFLLQIRCQGYIHIYWIRIFITITLKHTCNNTQVNWFEYVYKCALDCLKTLVWKNIFLMFNSVDFGAAAFYWLTLEDAVSVNENKKSSIFRTCWSPLNLIISLKFFVLNNFRIVIVLISGNM